MNTWQVTFDDIIWDLEEDPTPEVSKVLPRSATVSVLADNRYEAIDAALDWVSEDYCYFVQAYGHAHAAVYS